MGRPVKRHLDMDTALVAVVVALLCGLVIGTSFARSATSRPASEPIVSDLRPLVAPDRTEASQDPADAGKSENGPWVAVATPTRQPGGASLPAAEVGPDWGHDQPTATVAATVPEPSPVPSRTATVPGRTPTVAAAGVTGLASWYCLPGVSACTKGYAAAGLYAAAGPALRVGDWRGRVVTVCGIVGNQPARCTKATIIDWCQCYGSRVIDLYASVVAALGLSLSRGIYTVRVTW